MLIKNILRSHHIVEVLLCPTDESVDGRDERLSGVGEPVFYTRRYLSIDLAVDEMALVQFFEHLRD